MLVPVVIALLQPSAAAPKAEATPAHVIISEVLYAVPREGDPDQDGTRSATGDEFIELFNPTDKAVQLKGYTLSNGKSPAVPSGGAKGKDGGGDGKSEGKSGKGKSNPASGHRPEESRIHFTFPELTLAPGEVVVVFNEYESHTPGPVGDSKAAAGKNEKFGGAYVLSMHCTSQYQALANAGDCVLLCDGEGKALECVTWGSSNKKPEKEAPVTHRVEARKGSVQRTSAAGEFVAHEDLPAPEGEKAWSPGVFGGKK